MPVRKPPLRTRRELTPQPPGIRELRVDHERIYEAIDRQRGHPEPDLPRGCA